jgi:predicted Rossmann fold flavoprotein
VENKMKNKIKNYDVAVIGGGPAGMMAAITSSSLGAKTILIEKNDKLGIKLLLSGGGRCNLTSIEKNNREFCSKFGKNGDFLLSSFSIFNFENTIDFFEKNGLRLRKEGNKIYPENENSKDVLNVLIFLLKKYKVRILLSSEVKDIKKEDNVIDYISLIDGDKIKAKNYILSSGGKSYSVTGSTGDGFLWAEKLGHTVTDLKPSLTPVETKEKWSKGLQGISLKNISISLSLNDKKEKPKKGDLLFTHFGLSGPLILDASKEIEKLNKKGKLKIFLDLFPDKNLVELDDYIKKLFNKNRKRLLSSFLSTIFPERLSPFILNFSSISKTTKVNDITKEERLRLGKVLKKIEFNVVGLLGFDKAMVTSGGILLKEIDSRTMKSKIVNNLYFAGEIIDIDGPCGGYNLQSCWTTGYISGINSFKKDE